VTEDDHRGPEQPASGAPTPAGATWWETLREWGRQELSRRGYLIAAASFAVLAAHSVYKLLTPGHNAGFAALGLGGVLLSCGLMVAGYISRRRRDEREARP
jgi:hypothetical protein